jgi:hypothetical protein
MLRILLVQYNITPASETKSELKELRTDSLLFRAQLVPSMVLRIGHPRHVWLALAQCSSASDRVPGHDISSWTPFLSHGYRALDIQ